MFKCRIQFRWLRILGVAFVHSLVWCSQASLADDLFLDRVAPILQRRCVTCHNDSTHKGAFSVQSAESTFVDGYIVAGDSVASRLVELITPIDGHAQMPKDSDPLTAQEVEWISEWINAGAVWPKAHRLEEPSVQDFNGWSYLPIKRPDVPIVDSEWVRTPIDAFILDQLRQKGLTHSPPADRRTLIRRLTYDLTGLPPTYDEVQAFVSDPATDAYEKLVERLLASKHYGERWAQHWLDVVKYADSCGYDKDKLRPNAWPYRDYVIRSFNDDKPYARFVQEQIAGDALFPGEPDGILGLGFIAAGPWDFIGHVEVSESKIDGKVARNLDRDDMVSGTLNTFCSVTVQCARCHNHKFDPITQEHYYGLQAIFAAVDRADRPFDLDPEIERRRIALGSDIATHKASLQAIDKELDMAGGAPFAELKAQIVALQAKQSVNKSAAFGYHSEIAATPDAPKWVLVDLKESTSIAKIVLHPCHDEFANIGAGFGFPVRFHIEVSPDGQSWQRIDDRSNEDFPNPGLTPVEGLVPNLPIKQIRVTATKLSKRSNDFIFAVAELEALNDAGVNRALGAAVSSADSIEAPVRWSRNNLTDGQWAVHGDQGAAEQLALATQEYAAILSRIETPEVITKRKSIQDALASATADLAKLPAGRMVYAAATQFEPQGNFLPTKGIPRPIHLLIRGDIQQPREVSRAGVLPLRKDENWLMGDELDESQRRAELAKWLTSKEHPLLWRSIVNRIWQYHFGDGIVATPNDFGRMGAKPTHPELLDWLATEFRDGGQSMKALHRLIVTSNVYRQSSQGSAEFASNAAIDGGNQFLWRMNRRRLESEEIRDSILAVSGAMNPTMGGPGYYLFELERVEHSPHFEYHKFDPRDPASHRRSVYRFIARSQPDPWMTTLDCADSSQSTPKRIETLTSLQALSLLNHRFNLVMAERMAERLANDCETKGEQIDLAMQSIVQRLPEEMERDEMVRYAETHGLPNLCRMLFNLSEFVFLD